MDIKAFKMDGLGNDFVIIDNRQKITNLTKDQILKFVIEILLAVEWNKMCCRFNFKREK